MRVTNLDHAVSANDIIGFIFDDSGRRRLLAVALGTRDLQTITTCLVEILDEEQPHRLPSKSCMETTIVPGLGLVLQYLVDQWCGHDEREVPEYERGLINRGARDIVLGNDVSYDAALPAWLRRD